MTAWVRSRSSALTAFHAACSRPAPPASTSQGAGVGAGKLIEQRVSERLVAGGDRSRAVGATSSESSHTPRLQVVECLMVTAASDGLLTTRFVGDIEGDFFIPAYQRGYRWGEQEVRRLLDDIRDSPGPRYYLQPVVVKRRSDGSWELVDGQQRLTTLYLVLQYMKHQQLQNAEPTYSLTYETREGSQAYLQRPTEEESRSNIDFFHLFQAYKCIESWFEAFEHRRQHEANRFYGSLFEKVQVLWYEAPEQIDSRLLFTRLNVGRIPLTDAELVKALLLTRHREGPAGTDRSFEIAAQWDAFERDLRSPEVWAFVTGEAESQATHISLLLDTLAGGPPPPERPLFYTFETLRAAIEEDAYWFWNRVVDLHSLLVGWYEDRDLFHKIGFLIADGEKFADLVGLAQERGRSQFEAELDERIRRRLKLSAARLVELSYERDSAKCQQVLLLMNVETVRKMKNSSERYSFRAHASGSWSLEHIHAQNAEALRTEEEWAEWLRLHREALADLPQLGDDEREALIARIDAALPALNEQRFRELEQESSAVFTSAEQDSDGGVHSIANLALLDGRDNTALSNSMFEVKRREVIRRDKEGSYIPVCTRNVFLKYYTDADGQQLHFWGSHDRVGYLEAIQTQVADYLLPEEVDA